MRIRSDLMTRRRDRIAEVMARLTDDKLRTIERRAEHPAGSDGFKASSRLGPELHVGRTTHTASCMNGDTECNCVGFSGDTSSTERAALVLVEGRPVSDPQLTACQRIDSAFRECWKHVEEMDKAWDLIEHITDSRRGRETSISVCAACLRDVAGSHSDPITAGYCPSCYKAWQRTDVGGGRQDRMAFELDRRALKLVESDGEPA